MEVDKVFDIMAQFQGELDVLEFYTGKLENPIGQKAIIEVISQLRLSLDEFEDRVKALQAYFKSTENNLTRSVT